MKFSKLLAVLRSIINWFFPPNKEVDQFEHHHLDYEPEADHSWFHTIQKQPIILKGRRWTYVIRDVHTNGIICEISASTIKKAYYQAKKIYGKLTCLSSKYPHGKQPTWPILIGYHVHGEI